MADKKTLGVLLGAGAGAAVLLYLVTRAKAAPPPPEPEPGLANLFGRVIDAVTGDAVSGVLVTLDGVETYTGGNGNYSLENLEPGGYILQFSKEGYETAIY